jgi:hypothetical protein
MKVCPLVKPNGQNPDHCFSTEVGVVSRYDARVRRPALKFQLRTTGLDFESDASLIIACGGEVATMDKTP